MSEKSKVKRARREAEQEKKARKSLIGYSEC